MRTIRFAAYAWAVLAANLVVVVWGAFVRASGSGAGCGSHWPLCNGQVLPSAAEAATLIEFTHRVTSGLALLLVVVLLGWALARHAAARPSEARPTDFLRAPVRTTRAALARRPWGSELRAAALAMAFMISEALVGAGLVLFGLVADDDSVARAIVLAIHLVNTFFLLAFVALTAWWGSGRRPPQRRGHGGLAVLLGVALAATLAIGVTGAVTALGDTLFPAESLRAGIRDDFSATAHFLLRLRVLHPVLAVATGLYLLVVAHAVRARRGDPEARRLAAGIVALFFAQLAAGALNLLLLAPVWMQLVHLLLADLVWITLVLLTAATLSAAARAAGRDGGVAAPDDALPLPPVARRAAR
jgi:heme A synthase